MGEITIATPYGEMPSYVAAPSRPAPRPGVVVIHDFTGMSHDLRDQADWLASAGFLAAAPDLYYWGSRLRCLRTIMRDISARRGRTFDDIDSARMWQSTAELGDFARMLMRLLIAIIGAYFSQLPDGVLVPPTEDWPPCVSRAPPAAASPARDSGAAPPTLLVTVATNAASGPRCSCATGTGAGAVARARTWSLLTGRSRGGHSRLLTSTTRGLGSACAALSPPDRQVRQLTLV